MSMKFAGFMSAVNDHAEKKKEREHDMDLLEKKLEIEGVSEYQKQKLKDAKLQKDVDFAMDAMGIPASKRPAVARYVESLGVDGTMDMFKEGRLTFDNIGGSKGTTDTTGMAKGELSDNATYAYNYLVSKGESPTMAAAITGNLMQESTTSLNTTISGDGGNAYGIAQMNGDRKKRLFKWAEERGRNVEDIETQLDYMIWEGQNTEAGAWKAAQEAATNGSSAGDVAVILSDKYWRPGTPHNERRASYANQVYTTLFDDVEGADGSTMDDTTMSAMNEPSTTEVSAAKGTDQPDTSNDDLTATEATPAAARGGVDGIGVLTDQELAARNEESWWSEELGSATSKESLVALKGRIRNNRTMTEQEKKTALAEVDTQMTEYDALDREEAKDPEYFATRIGESNDVSELIALEGEVKQSGRFDTEQDRQDLLNLIGEQKMSIAKAEADEAMRNGDPMMFVPYAPDGSLDGGAMMMVRNNGGGWVNMDGSPANATTANGTFISQETQADVVKLHNTALRGVTDVVANGQKAATALLDYRELVRNNSASVNPIVRFLGGTGETLASIRAAMGSVGGTYQYDLVDGILDGFEDLSEHDKDIMQAQLHAAYQMAAVKGSTGQALSDKELRQNLEAIGVGEQSPKKIIGMVNRALRNQVIRPTESERATRMNSMAMSSAGRATMNDLPISQDFREYFFDELGRVGGEEMQQEYREAMAGKTDYPFRDHTDLDNGLGAGVEKKIEGLGSPSGRDYDTPSVPEAEEPEEKKEASRSELEVTEERVKNAPGLEPYLGKTLTIIIYDDGSQAIEYAE